MVYLERKPGLPLRHFVQNLWYVNGPAEKHCRERMLPSGCAHIVLSLSRDYLTECKEGSPDRRISPALLVGQRSLYELISTSDFTDQAGVLFRPGIVPALLSDRADLISNCNFPLHQMWPDGADYLRGRLLEGSSSEARLRILEDCLVALLDSRITSWTWSPHPAVRFALDQFERRQQLSVAELARQSGWSERHFTQTFREKIGFTPKVWNRLLRFQRAVRQLQAAREVSWAELAIDCGYYDQSHFANEFRTFAGIDLTTYTAGLS